MIGSDSVREVVICPSCGADEMGCAVKLGLGGRPCCDQCDHDLHLEDRGDLQGVEHHDDVRHGEER